VVLPHRGRRGAFIRNGRVQILSGQKMLGVQLGVSPGGHCSVCHIPLGLGEGRMPGVQPRFQLGRGELERHVPRLDVRAFGVDLLQDDAGYPCAHLGRPNRGELTHDLAH